MNGPYYIISDNHFSMDLNQKEHDRRQKIFQVFDKIKSLNKGTLIIGGDFFDYWFEYKNEIPKGYEKAMRTISYNDVAARCLKILEDSTRHRNL